MVSDSAFVGTFNLTSDSQLEDDRPVLYQHAAGPAKVLTTVPSKHVILAIRNPRYPTAGSFSTQPFDDSPIILYSSKQRTVLVIRREASKGTLGIAWIDAVHGKPVQSRSYPTAGILIPAQIRDSLINHHTRRILRSPTSGGGSGGSVEARVRAALFLPVHYPPVSEAFVDELGRIWLRREAVHAPTVTWEVVSTTGTLVGQVRLPAKVRTDGCKCKRGLGLDLRRV